MSGAPGPPTARWRDAASEEAARAEALAECERRRADRNLEAPCALYAVGDERVAGDPD